MQNSKMFYFTKFLLLLSVLYVVAIAAPYQELLPKSGYIPVYIREGNTPLSQINPKLVEAFHEDEGLSPNVSKESDSPTDFEVTHNNRTNQVTENIKIVIN